MTCNPLRGALIDEIEQLLMVIADSQKLPIQHCIEYIIFARYLGMLLADAALQSIRDERIFLAQIIMIQDHPHRLPYNNNNNIIKKTKTKRHS